MTLDAVVADASSVVALLVDGGRDGAWAAERLSGRRLVAPALIGFEVGNVLRRSELTAALAPEITAQAHRDLLDLDIELWPYPLLAERVWRHRANLTVHDASYVAVAEIVTAPLVTLDRRLARAPGLTCEVLAPDP